LGFGNFSSRGTGDMIMRNTNTGGLELYDIANTDRAARLIPFLPAMLSMSAPLRDRCFA
jgi:hypothetical protein